MTKKNWNVLVTGGAGYVGSALVPKLLEAGHGVTVLDLYLYGDEALKSVRGHAKLREVKGDLRDAAVVADALTGCDAVIHLACISNDPSYDLDPDLGKSINFDAFRPLIRAAKDVGVSRFIYASSSSVYGIKDEPEVTEDLPLEPLTDYSKFKALCEKVLEEEREPGFVTCTIRPSTVCGYAPRQRLDVIVNILTNHAVNRGRIRVFGGSQKRPNIHIDDMVDLYLFLLDQPDEKIDGKIYNAGYENHTVMQLAEMVKAAVGGELAIDVEPTDDLRSYHVSSDKMRRELGFEPTHSIEDAVKGLVEAFKDGRLPNSMDDPRYFNINLMKQVNLK
jgi:nucleoside-diphosphate-sugar epimerase